MYQILRQVAKRDQGTYMCISLVSAEDEKIIMVM